jgi:hypothetical protein
MCYTFHRVHTEWRLPISSVRPITMEKSALAGEGWGCTPTPLQPITITYTVAVYAPAERTDTLPLFHLYPMCMYSVIFLSPRKESVLIYNFLQEASWSPSLGPRPSPALGRARRRGSSRMAAVAAAAAGKETAPPRGGNAGRRNGGARSRDTRRGGRSRRRNTAIGDTGTPTFTTLPKERGEDFEKCGSQQRRQDLKMVAYNILQKRQKKNVY